MLAWTRMWTSSPICTPWAASAEDVDRAVRLQRLGSTGPRHRRRKRRRSMAAGVSRPNHGVSPGPWLSGAKARLPPAVVLDHPDRLGRTERGHHRDHRVVCRLAASSRTSPAGQQPVGLVDAAGPALGHHGGPHGPPQRVADVGVGDRRAAVEERPPRQPGHHVAGRRDRDQLGSALVEPAHAPRRWPRRWPPPAGRRAARGGHQLRLAAGRDAPVHGGQREALRGDGVGEQRRARRSPPPPAAAASGTAASAWCRRAHGGHVLLGRVRSLAQPPRSRGLHARPRPRRSCDRGAAVAADQACRRDPSSSTMASRRRRRAADGGPGGDDGRGVQTPGEVGHARWRSARPSTSRAAASSIGRASGPAAATPAVSQRPHGPAHHLVRPAVVEPAAHASAPRPGRWPG